MSEGNDTIAELRKQIPAAQAQAEATHETVRAAPVDAGVDSRDDRGGPNLVPNLPALRGDRMAATDESPKPRATRPVISAS